MACLVLRAYLKTTYRGVLEVLELSPPLQEVLELSPPLQEVLHLQQLPHYSTLKRFADRTATNEQLNRLLAQVLHQDNQPHSSKGSSSKGSSSKGSSSKGSSSKGSSSKGSSSKGSSSKGSTAIAIDSTGLETTSASAHYRSRSGRRCQHYVKLSLGVLCESLLPCALVVSWGPTNDRWGPTNDRVQVKDVLDQAQVNTRAAGLEAGYVLADAGYDAEWIHRRCRQEWGVESVIALHMRRADGRVGGAYRSQMLSLPSVYGRRWHIESFISGLKRTTGAALRARQPATLFAEAGLRVLTYALKR